MRVIGLTGGIGSGKSTVSAAFASRGAVVVDADAITRELQEPGTEVFEAMVDRFGPGIVGSDGRLDRPAVADLVFTDPAALADLNGIVHPAVGVEIARRLEEHATEEGILVLDVPLLVESGRDGFEALIVVDVDPELAIERLVEHRGFREADARARVGAQVSREERLANADIVIDNSGDLAALEDQVRSAWDQICSPGGTTVSH